jgi:hypothetical protein
MVTKKRLKKQDTSTSVGQIRKEYESDISCINSMSTYLKIDYTGMLGVIRTL